MLVTLRRQGEALLIGGDIEVNFIRVGPSKVQVAIRAPLKYHVRGGGKIPAPQVLPSQVEESSDRQDTGSKNKRISPCFPFKQT